MLKWPNVPDVFGWLRLDRRGNWLLRVQDQRFERIGNAGLVDFISRNYERDDEGRFFFQNGPQRVFAGLDYTPYVYRLADDRRSWLAHTGKPAGTPRQLLVDECDNLLLVTGLGPGLVLDRDLPALVDALAEEGAPADMESLLSRLRAAGGRPCTGLRLFDVALSAAATHSSELARQFGYVTEPEPTKKEKTS